MTDKRMQPTWDPIAFAAQLRNIARQSQVMMRHFVSHQPDAIKFGMGGRSTLGFDFFELMTRMMTDPVAVASALAQNRGTHAHAACTRRRCPKR